jgi:hypothetical protein
MSASRFPFSSGGHNRRFSGNASADCGEAKWHHDSIVRTRDVIGACACNGEAADYASFGGSAAVYRIAGILISLLLGACVTRDPYVTLTNAAPSGNWRIERQPDRITGKQLASAQLMTATSSNSAVATTRTAGLQLTCFDKQPLVRISFDFKIGSDKNTILGYRFDEKPGHDNVASRILAGYQIIVIEDKAAVAQFVSELAGSSVLYLRIRSLNAGRSTAEFHLAGAPAAVQAAFADCPLEGHTPSRPAS